MRSRAPVALASLIATSGCSLDYLDENVGVPGSTSASGDGGGSTVGSGGGSAGSGPRGCGCGVADGTRVLYDEEFDAPSGWCNENLGILADVGANADLDPDVPTGEGAGCQGLHVGCADFAGDCLVRAYDTFPPTTGAIFLRVRIRIDGAWSGMDFSWVTLLHIARAGREHAFSLVAFDTPDDVRVLPCVHDGCHGNGGGGVPVRHSNSEWHTLAVRFPNDGTTAQFQWDGTNSQDIATTPVGYELTTFTIGWETEVLAAGPNLTLDSIRICGETGAADCEWEDPSTR